MTVSVATDIYTGMTSAQYEEAYLALVRTADLLTRELVALLRPHDLTPAQYDALRILRDAGAEGLLTGEVGERLVRLDPDVTRLLDRMEKRGLVWREREPGDRRCVRVTITKAGRALVDRLDAPVLGLHEGQFRAIDAAALERLFQVLDDLRARDEP